MSKVLFCPNYSSNDWKNLMAVLNSEVEAHYQYNKNGHEIPNFAIGNAKDAYDYIKSFPEITEENKNTLRVKVGPEKDYAVYINNLSSVRAKIEKVNKVFPNLLSVELVPIKETAKNIQNIHSSGRKNNAYVQINHESLDHYHAIFSRPKSIKRYPIINTVEQRKAGEEALRVQEEGGFDFGPIGKPSFLDKYYKDLNDSFDHPDDVYYQNNTNQSTEDYVASEKTIRDLAERIADRIGLKVRYESDRTKDYKGKLEGNTAVINLAYATLDTPIHEILGHPIIRAIKKRGSEQTSDPFMQMINDDLTEDSQLYQNLLKELETGRGKEVLDRIKRDYKYKGSYEVREEVIDNKTKYAIYNVNNNERVWGNQNTPEDAQNVIAKLQDSSQLQYTLEEQQEEAIVELLGLYTADRLDKVKDGKLISLLKRLLKEMKAFMRSLMGQKEVEIDKLPDNMTLGDIADLLAYSNSKLILPGNEVVYTTPDNQTFKTYQEASNHISDLIKSGEKVDLSKVEVKNQSLEKEIAKVSKKIEAKKVEIESFINDNEAGLSLDREFNPSRGSLNKYNVSEYTNIRIESTTRPQIYDKSSYGYESYSLHRDILGDNYEGFYIHAYNTGIAGKTKIIPISKEEAKELYKSASKYERLSREQLDILNDLERDYHNLKSEITRLKKSTITAFISKNKEYEQSAEIIEEWKKVNNIKYDPEEVYSRGQGFYSVVGAYSDFDVELMFQNLLSHIEDNKKAGGEFTISAFTKPVDKEIGHLEGGGGKIKFKIFPKSEDIKWAANTDVYSGSVWDASEKVSKDTKSELIGVSYTKSPSLSNINSVQPNLASIIDNLAHHHNELGIELTGENFRLEYDDNVPYSTKKLINNINSILDQKFGKLVEPKIQKEAKHIKISKEEYTQAKNKGKVVYQDESAMVVKYNDTSYTENIDGYFKNISAKQPTQTKNSLKESIKSVQKKIGGEVYTAKSFEELNELEDAGYEQIGEGTFIKPKEYTSQAEINTKIAALKKANRKYPRSLIRSSVLKNRVVKSTDLGFGTEELPFQKVPKYEQRINDKLQPEERKDFEKKKEIMLKSFPFVKEVIEDYEMSSAGAVLPGGSTVKVNPLHWTRSTLGHEFGHILIDSIGGLSNPLIKSALESLEDSDIWNEYKIKYSDFYENKDDRFYKEVLAEAIGRETDIQFQNDQKKSKFARVLARIMHKLRILLGITNKDVAKLASMVIKGSPVLETGTSAYYEQKTENVKTDNVKDTSKKEKTTDIDRLYDDVLRAMRTKYNKYDKEGRSGKTKKIEELITKLEGLDKDIPRALEIFQDFAVNQIDAIYRRYEEFTKGRLDFDTDALAIRELARWRDYVIGFKSLDEIGSLAQGLALSHSVSDDVEAIKKYINIDKINNAVRKQNTILKFYQDKGVELAAKFLTPYSSHIEADFRDLAEDAYNKLSKEEKKKTDKNNFIEDFLELKEDEIEELTRSTIESELRKASKDINAAEALMDNILDSPDMVVSSMVKAFSKAMYDSRIEFVNLERELISVTQKLESHLKNTGIFGKLEEQYDFILEKDLHGNLTGHIVSPYRSSFNEAKTAFRNKKINEGYEGEKLEKEIRKWNNSNAPISVENKRRRKDDIIKMINSLYEDGEISEVERKRLIGYQNELSQGKTSLEKLEINEHAIELYQAWINEHAADYRTPNNEWLNPQWKELVKLAGGDITSSLIEQEEQIRANKTNSPEIEFYNKIKNEIDKQEKKLPYRNRLGTKLPGVMKDVNERLKSTNLTNALTYGVTNTFDVLADDTERGAEQLTDEEGNKVLFIPVYYTNNLRDKYIEEFRDMDEDKQKVYLDKYKEYYKAEPKSFRDSIDETNYAALQYSKEKASQDQSYDVAGIYSKYFHSSIEYAHKHEILPQMELVRFMVNSRDMIKTNHLGKAVLDKIGNKVLKQGDTNIAKQLNDWFEALVYGIKEKDEGTWLNGKVDRGKLANAMNKYASLNMLGFNLVQGSANVLLGSTMQFIESVGGQYYNSKDLAKANGIYAKNLVGIMGDIGTRFPKNKLSLMNKEFDILNEYSDGKYRKNSKFRQLLSTNTLFFTTHAGEHFMQTKVALAMLNRIEAKDKQGNVLGKMVDMMRVENGKLVFKHKNGTEVANFGPKERSNFNNRVKRVLSSIHGEYSQEGRVAIQRYALGRLALMFRKFIATGIRRRFGKERVNNMLGEKVEGNYVTFSRFMKRFVKDLEFLRWTVASEHWDSLRDREKANIKKTLAEASFMLAAIIVSHVLINMKGDDDEEWINSFLAYQALRYKAELLFFLNPAETMKILKSPAAAMSMIENTIRLTNQIIYPITSGDFEYERFERGNWKGKYKISKTMVNYIPVVKQVYRLQYVDDQLALMSR